MATLNVSVIPIVTLVGINHQDVVAAYHRGEFVNIRIPKISTEARIKCDEGIANPTYDQTGKSSTFCFRSKSDTENVFVTTGNDSYKAFHLEGKGYGDGICDQCGLHYDSGMGGIPVMCEIQPVGTKLIPVMSTIKRVCGYRCGLRYIRQRSKGCTRFNNYDNSESWLKCMYRLDYPEGPELVEALDPGHIDTRGGTMTEEQYRNTRYQYIQTSNHFISQPIKECYIRSETAR